ncbi:MAG TPA: uroporphyrinogen decarboxylase family protein [Candidatus Bipolaricaulota bacterium]
MTHKQRIQAAIGGKPLDRLPVALWRHFPREDATAEGLARSVVQFQQRFDFDLVKVTPVAGYPAEAWGATLHYLDNANGTRGYTHRPVQSAADWHALARLDVRQGLLGRELHALRLIRQGVGPDVHVMQTIFSPLTIARNLSDALWKEHLQQEPGALHAGLQIITQTTADFAKACLQEGADSLFFATQLASFDELSQPQYEAFGMAYDLQILKAIRGQTDLVLLHVHGLNVMFELACRYPVDALNWHDRRTAPTLARGLEQFEGTVLGGLDEHETLSGGTPDQVRAQAQDAIAQTQGKRFILGAGCVALVTTPEENFQAAKEAASFSPSL